MNNIELGRRDVSLYRRRLAAAWSHEETLETIVPDALPDISRILLTDGTVLLRSKELLGGKVTVGGTVSASALYVPEGDGGVRRLELNIPFSASTAAGETDAMSQTVVRLSLSAIETRMMNPRKVLARAEVLIDAEVYEPGRVELRTAPESDCPEVELLPGSAEVSAVVGVREKTFAVSDDFTYPGSNPDMGEVLLTRLLLGAVEAKPVGNKLILKGVAAVKVLYSTPAGELASHVYSTTYSQIMESPTENEEAVHTVTLTPTGVYFEDGKERGVSIELRATAQVVTEERTRLDYIADCYSTSRTLDCRCDSAELEGVRRRSVQRETVRATLELPRQAHSVADALLRTGRPRCADGRFTVPVTAEAVYLTESGEAESVTKRFEAALERESVEGVVCPEASVTEELLALPASGGIELRIPLDFRLQEPERTRVEFLSSVGFDEGETRDLSATPSVTVLRVGEEDTVWKLAKRCGSTRTLIEAANSLSAGAEPPPGTLLIVPKKR